MIGCAERHPKERPLESQDVGADAECSTEPPRRKLRSTSMHGNQMGTVMESSMPPNKDDLCLLVKRANYQTVIYKRALDPHPVVPSPHGHGWKINGDDISIHWMDLPPAPTSVMEFAHCSCKKNCHIPTYANAATVRICKVTSSVLYQKMMIPMLTSTLNPLQPSS